MPFAYYERLSARDKATYRKSDEITRIALPDAAGLHGAVAELQQALARDDRRSVEAAAERLALGISRRLGIGPVRLSVLAVRPSSSWGELHGLYTREAGRVPRIQLWMRTARHKRVVAFRTFVRTLLHEVGHHVDYDHLRLGDSFHTEGFFRRESSLFKQLVPEGRPEAELDGPDQDDSPPPGRK